MPVGRKSAIVPLQRAVIDIDIFVPKQGLGGSASQCQEEGAIRSVDLKFFRPNQIFSDWRFFSNWTKTNAKLLILIRQAFES